jgi:hypothetical protein
MTETKKMILEYLDEAIETERDNWADICRDGHRNTCGGGMSIGTLDTLKLVKEFIEENLK